MLKRMGRVLICAGCFTWLLCSCDASSVSTSINPKQLMTQASLNPFVFNEKKNMKSHQLLYVIDSHQHVVPWKVELPVSNKPIQQTIEALVKEGTLSNKVPNGLALPLPRDTTVKYVDVRENGEAVIDLSSSFLDYPQQQESIIFEALTQSLIQLTEVKNITFKIDGKPLQETQYNHEFIADGLDKRNGVNLVKGPGGDLNQSEGVKLYLLSGHQNNTYYVPLTISAGHSNNEIKQMVRLMMMSDWNEQSIFSPLNEGSKLTKAPVIKDKQLELVFNKQTLTDRRNQTISEELLTCIALTFINDKTIQSVVIHVQGIDKSWEINVKGNNTFVYTVTNAGIINEHSEVSG